jgi:DDE superfamily endonuclease
MCRQFVTGPRGSCGPILLAKQGSTNDSAALASSKLYDLLLEKADFFAENNFFLVGDAAYNLSPFLITPYEVDELEQDVDGMKDSFNYHLSSCRIFIECAFGELVVMRWDVL